MSEFLRLIEGSLDYTREFIIVSLILARTMPMVYLTPFLAGKIAPMEVKMGLGILITILVWPAARAVVPDPLPHTAPMALALMIKETFLGFVIGFLNAHAFFAMDMAGRLIDTVRGTSMSEVQDPHSKQRATPVGDLYSQLFLITFVVIGGHHIFLEGYFESFRLLPLTEFLKLGGRFEELAWHVGRLTASLLVLAVVLAAPIMAATFISDVVFGILNRVAPQLNAYFMSMPVKAMAGIIMIFLSLTAIMDRFEDFVVWTLKGVKDAVTILAG